MIRVLFVCHGNICRSPMAEFIFKDMVSGRNLADRFYIASAATSTEEIWNGIGNPVYPPAREELARHGISCKGKRAVQLTKADYEKYDYILGMDHWNLKNMMRILKNDPEGKVKLLLDYSDNPRDIADPWYTGGFDVTYSDVVEGCEAFLKYLLYKWLWLFYTVPTATLKGAFRSLLFISRQGFDIQIRVSCPKFFKLKKRS